MSELKIAVNGRALSTPEPGGDVQAGLSIVRELDHLPDTEVVILGHKSVQKRFSDINVYSGMIPFNSQLYGVLWEQMVPPWQAEKIGADVLLCPNGNGPITDTKIPVVTIIQSIFAYKGMAPLSYQLLQRVRAPLVANRTDTVVTVSEYLKRELVEHLGTPEESISVIYNGIDNIYKNDEPGSHIELPEKYLLFVGSMNRRKNIKTLIELFPEIHSRFGHELVIVGPRKKRIFEQAGVPESVHESIHDLGFISEQELKYVYQNASVFVFPSLYETFGLPPLEAMACGTPVVASNRPALPEILSDAARFVNPLQKEDIKDGITEVLNNDSRRDELIRAGKKRAERFDWRKTAEELRALLERIATE